jgi:hypothetical protein
MDNSIKIYEFDPCVYPRLLWVVKGGTLAEISKVLELSGYEEDESVGAVTLCNVRRKTDENLGALVWFPKASNIKNLDWIAHECTHVAMYMFGETGCIADVENQEPLAYLVGWAFSCVDKVRKSKGDSVPDGCRVLQNKDKTES